METMESSWQKENNVTIHRNMDWSNIISDPASFVVIGILRSKKQHDYRDLQNQFPMELRGLLRSILEQLEKYGAISISEEKIILLDEEFLSISQTHCVEKFLPELNAEATRIVLKNIASGTKGNSYKFLAVPRNRETVKRIREASAKYKAELEAIAANPGDSDFGYTMQYVSLLNVELKLGDFV